MPGCCRGAAGVLPGVAGLPGTWTHVLTAGLGSQAAGLPGCNCRVAGCCRVLLGCRMLPGRCRVVAGLGCRVAGARAQGVPPTNSPCASIQPRRMAATVQQPDGEVLGHVPRRLAQRRRADQAVELNDVPQHPVALAADRAPTQRLQASSTRSPYLAAPAASPRWAGCSPCPRHSSTFLPTN